MTENLLPPLSIEELEALKADIDRNGVLHPVIVDENDKVLDGRHRLMICPDAPKRIVTGLTEAEKLAFTYRANFTRRNLSPAQKTEARKQMKTVALALKKEGKTQEDVGALLGVYQSTVSKWFNNTDADNTTNMNGHNGCIPRNRVPDSRVKVPASEHEAIQQRLEAGEPQAQVAADYGVTQQQIGKIAKKQRKQKEPPMTEDIASPDNAQLIHSDFRDVDLPRDSIDVIITDPPYPKKFLPLYNDLFKYASRILKPGGSLLVMCGQSYLPDIFRFETDLVYHWALTYLTPGGQSPQIWPRKINTFWKPVLWFVKGEYQGGWHGDVIKSDVNDNDKRFHKWGQSESGMARLVENFTKLGDTVLDPFMGGGTTGVVAVILGRKFIGIDIDAKSLQVAQERIQLLLRGSNNGA